MPTTSKGFRYPSGSAAPNVPQDIQNLAADVNSKATVSIADVNASGSGTLGTGPSWNDILTVTATSYGGVCVARFAISAFNGNSGADRTAIFRVICDSTTLWTSDTVTLPLAGAASPTRVRFGNGSSTPAAGTHTWKIQGQASTAAAVITDSASLTVVEK